MKIVSSFTHPQVFSNLFNFLSWLKHDEDILNNDGNQRVTGIAIDFHSREREREREREVVQWLPTFFKKKEKFHYLKKNLLK